MAPSIYIIPVTTPAKPHRTQQKTDQIQLRNEARANKDFLTSDTIRKELADQGIILEDRPDGTTRWKR